VKPSGKSSPKNRLDGGFKTVNVTYGPFRLRHTGINDALLFALNIDTTIFLVTCRRGHLGLLTNLYLA
jgi:hypothetical protein